MCSEGVKKFVDSKLEDRKYTVSELLKICRGQKGFKYFSNYFDKGSKKIIHEPDLILR
jgi:hypothetical protein